MFEAWLGSVVWILANVVYVSHVREGERGFKRFAAFWLGFPITLLSAFAVSESRQRRKHSDGDALDAEEEAELLREIHRDRLLRGRHRSDENEGDS
jgi:hypothetical protein